MKDYSLKVTSAIAVGGQIVKAGAILRGVPEKDARRLLARGKAELATEDDVNAEAEDDLSEDDADAETKPKGKAKAKPATDEGEGK